MCIDLRVLVLSSLAWAGCDGTGIAVEERLTIEVGLYGQLTRACADPDCEPPPLLGWAVSMHDGGANPLTGLPELPDPVLVAQADDVGFWEISVPVGEVLLCAGRGTDPSFSIDGICTLADVNGDLTRHDYTFGTDGGEWRTGLPGGQTVDPRL